MKEIDKNKIRKVLVVRTDRMGDVLLNIPAIRALKRSFNAYIIALIHPSIKGLIAEIPEIDETLLFDERKWNKGIFTKLSLLRQIRNKKFDLAVVLNPTKRFHILTFLANIPFRLGYGRKWGFLLTNKIEDRKYQGQKHEIEYNLDLVRSIGADTDDLHISINIEKKEEQFVKELLLKYGIKDEDLVVAIHPHTSNAAKCWPRENFAQVSDKLKEDLNAKVVIIGGKEERTSAIKIVSLTKYSPVNLCGKLTLKELGAFFQRCALLISNDSGPVHIAAAVGTRCLVIFGRNAPGVGPRRWGPWGKGHIILHKDPGCNPCLDRNCPYNFKCLTLITPEEVLQAIEQHLIQR